jgi:zinc/manganese transport system substrate-binding protein
MPNQWLRSFASAAVALLAVAACGTSGSTGGSSSNTVEVVAAENFWGSIITQVGGSHVHVTSIIASPDADPHSYEPTPNDAKLIARAKYAVINGIGYDPWATKLADANPASGRQVLTIGDYLGKKDGDNPHMWYSPDLVTKVIDKMTADLKKIDPSNASDYDQQSSQYRTQGLKAYHDAIAAIKQKYSGVPVGASESIFAYMSPALGLDLITPPEYLKAVTEGTDISPADKATVQQQIASKQIKVLVFNSQNSTPDVQQAVDQAKGRGIPVSAITETLSPAKATFQDWQTNQLKSLMQALGG